jgi:type II secretory pathway component PulC
MRTSPQWSLTGIAVVLLLGVIYELFAPQSAYSVPQAHVTAVPVIPRPPTPFVFPSASEFAAISEHPLFDSHRKKYVPPPVDAAAKSAPPPLPNLSLVGVIIDADRKLAMVKYSEGTLASSVGIGTEINGWQVAVIDPDRIVLKAGSSEQEVRLDANKAPPQSAPSSPGFAAHPVQAQAPPLSNPTKSAP